MSADAVELLKQEHAEELQSLRSQAARAQELEMELTKTQKAESELQLEFDRQLAKERETLSAKYDSEVDELCASLESLRELDNKQHDTDLSAWCAWDHMLHSGLLGLEDALHGKLLPPPPSLCSFKPFPHFLVALAGAFPDSDGATIAALEKYRAEQKIIPCDDPKVKFTFGELMALVKG
jgi:hypothetical protein